MNQSFYCVGCNARFRQALGQERCPQCGADLGLPIDAALDETLLVKGRPADVPDDPADADSDLRALIGSRLHVYECRSLLGRGGMGYVFLAHHCDLTRHCALKILSPRLARRDADYVGRFSDEGRAAAALIHPNIVTTHAIGEARGYHFLEMEYVAGRSLQQLLQDEGAMTATRATALAASIAHGLAVAHSEGIIHRDLKPDNVMLTPEGVPKITDFGLAKQIFGPQGQQQNECLVGTPNFLAPELFHGKPASKTSDVYALGVCYFLMLTGRLPFVGASIDLLMSQVSTQPVPNVRREFPRVSLEMAECLNLLLDKSECNRPPDAIAAAQLLNAVLGQIRDIESLLKEAFQNMPNVRWTRCENRYRLSIDFAERRRQTLFVEPSEHGAADRLLLIYSVCCKAQAEYFEQALRLNSKILHGGLAIRDIDGEPTFVVVDTYPRTTVNAEEIRRSVFEVARYADAVEKQLTGLDRN